MNDTFHSLFANQFEIFFLSTPKYGNWFHILIELCSIQFITQYVANFSTAQSTLRMYLSNC